MGTDNKTTDLRHQSPQQQQVQMPKPSRSPFDPAKGVNADINSKTDKVSPEKPQQR